MPAPSPFSGGRVRFIGSFPGPLPPPGLPEVAFLGRSNVGKSSCINTLVQVRGTARTSRTPGRTQAINLFDVAGALLLADLPGYGFAKVPPKVQAAWKPLVEAYLFGRPSLVLSILLVDVRRPPGGMDADLLWSLRENRVPVVLVVTRCDKLSRQELQKALGILEREYRLPEGDLIPFSSLTGLGRDALVARIERNLR